MSSYDLVERIDGERGGFADVWRAVRREDRLEFAVKMLRDFRNPDARHRFEREVRQMVSYGHGAIIKIVEYNLTTHQPFYVMGLMRGGCLSAWAGRLPMENCRRVIVILADCLAYLHGRNALHRDMKLDNVLVDAKGNIAVGDFGLGNDPRCTVMFTVSAVGTPGHVAPELWNGTGMASPASDVFSLGATIFHLLTGTHPRLAASLDPWSINRAIPQSLRDLVVVMCQEDPRARPSARGVAAAARTLSLRIASRPNPQPRAPSVADVLAPLAVGAIAIAGVFGLATLFSKNA